MPMPKTASLHKPWSNRHLPTVFVSTARGWVIKIEGPTAQHVWLLHVSSNSSRVFCPIYPIWYQNMWPKMSSLISMTSDIYLIWSPDIFIYTYVYIYIHPSYIPDIIYLIYSHMGMGQGVKSACTPAVHINISGIYGSSPVTNCIHRNWSIAIKTPGKLR